MGKDFAWDYAVVQVPDQLFQLPKMWDPRLAWHYAYLMRDSSVLPVDWSLGRENVDGVAQMIGSQPPREMHLWCPSWHALNRALLLKERLERNWTKTKFKILGMPRTADTEYDKWIGETSLASINIVEPIWTPFNKEVYFQNNQPFERERNLYSILKENYFEYSPTPWTRDSISWTRRGSMCFRFPSGAVAPERAARILQKTKTEWWYDALEWRDDLTADDAWTTALLREVEKREFHFQFSCMGDYHRVSITKIRNLRENGLALMDFGEIPLSLFSSPAESERLRAAFIACRSSEVRPTMTPVIDGDTTLDLARDACGFCVEFRMNDKPEVQVVPEKMTAKELRAIAGGKWYNPTKLKDIEVLGIMEAFTRAKMEIIR